MMILGMLTVAVGGSIAHGLKLKDWLPNRKKRDGEPN
jgi:hypothetical protein